MKQDSTSRLEELDSLRGLAALSVVFSHFKLLLLSDTMHDWAPLSRRVFISLAYPVSAGHEAVILFFILSGFVLSIPALNLQAQRYQVFVIRRIFRIYLPYLVALIPAIFGAMILHGQITKSSWFNQFWSNPVDWGLVAQHILFIGRYDTDQFNNPIWSLVYEMRISLVFPFLCAIALRVKPAQSLILAACMSGASALTCALLLANDQTRLLVYTLHYAALFIVGIYVARQRGPIAQIFSRCSMHVKIGIALLSASLYVYGAFVCGIMAQKAGRPNLYHSEDWITALGASGVIVLSLNSRWLSRVLHLRVVHSLGKMSYSVYLLHFIVLLFCVHLLYGKVPMLGILGICLALVILASWGFYRWVEIPSIDLGRKLSGYLR